ncbi:type II secretion system F family protein [Microbacterium sp. gxy059]|uniref:type II secretion system F family protein n=1 Tax=Microbacterium sp. gxy059 TaxID=2957199 RepID=UPI003D9676C6
MGVLTRRREETVHDAAETILSLAVLLEAGASPARAWRHIADAGDAAARQIVDRAEAGAPLAAAIAAQQPDRSRSTRGLAEDGTAWGDVAAAWEVAETVGAPLAETLRGVARSLRDAEEVRDDVRVALAEPAASARLMAWLPVLGVVVGLGLGLDPVGVLLGSLPGALCLGGGLLLVLASRLWTGRIVRTTRPPAGTPGIHEELLAIALTGGVSVERGEEVLGRAAEWMRTSALGEGAGVRRVLALSREAGVPAVELLRAEASHQRHRARTAGRLAGARIGTRLLLPMGVCTLPAFLLLGVAPMLLAVLQSTPLPDFAG